MHFSEREQYIIERYEQDEAMMIYAFSQWCVNNDLDAYELYEQAYPSQKKNEALSNALAETVAKDESEHISKAVVIYLLQLFGNDELAYVVEQTEISD